jgi:NADH dehydrogenase
MAKKIVIIGGGFAGLDVAKNVTSNGYQVTLVDRNNYIFFPPLLYQVATGFLEASNISYPYRKMFRNRPNLNFRLGEVLRIIPEHNKIVLTTGELEYDYLVFATGTKTNYFGMENVRQKAIPMKTINDALEMRNYILQQLELATTLTLDKDRLRKILTLVVVGGGPTGVEISGMLAQMRTAKIRKDYPELEKEERHIYLVDGNSQLLSPMSKKSQNAAFHALKKLGVQIILNAHVIDFVEDKVKLSNGQIIETENLVWSAGVTSQIFEGLPKECYGRGGRLITDAYNKVEGLVNVYAVGDTCIQATDKRFPSGHPQVAQVALQQGKNLAKNFERLLKSRPLSPFIYKDRGAMAIIGRNKAVADIPPNIHFDGFVAWCIWLFVHLGSLVHYRNKVTTLYNWIVAYFTKDQGLRMIIRPSTKKT